MSKQLYLQKYHINSYCNLLDFFKENEREERGDNVGITKKKVGKLNFQL